VKIKVRLIYTAPYRDHLTPKVLRYESQFYLQTTPYLPLPHSNGATTDCNGRHLMAVLLLIHRPQTDGRLSWPGWLAQCGRFTPISCRASTRQEKFAGHRRVFYHRTMQQTCGSLYYFCAWTKSHFTRTSNPSNTEWITLRLITVSISCHYTANTVLATVNTNSPDILQWLNQLLFLFWRKSGKNHTTYHHLDTLQAVTLSPRA